EGERVEGLRRVVRLIRELGGVGVLENAAVGKLALMRDLNAELGDRARGVGSFRRGERVIRNQKNVGIVARGERRAHAPPAALRVLERGKGLARLERGERGFRRERG